MAGPVDVSSTSVDFDAFPLTALDREILAMNDEDYHAQDWEECKQLIAENKLEQFKRYPSDLRKYLAWSQSIKQQYGGITNYVLTERLHWTPVDPDAKPPVFEFRDATPFADTNDYTVLRNDWPYGLAKGISHLLVWLKTPLAIDQGTGDLTDAARHQVNNFVERFFVQSLELNTSNHGSKDRVLWFKNWVALQSVRGVDHIHVLARDVPEDLIRKWTAT